MRARLKRRCSAERGSVMIITLAFLAFAGAVVVALLTYSSNALGATNQLASLRGTDYDADGLLDATIATIRTSTSQGYVGACISNTLTSLSLQVNNSSDTLRVDCTPKVAPVYQREMLLSVCKSTVLITDCTATGSTSWLLRAHVKFYDDSASGGFGGAVVVDTWSAAP